MRAETPLAAAVIGYCTTQRRRGVWRSDRTVDTNRATLLRFAEVVGREKPAGRLTRRDLNRWLDSCDGVREVTRYTYWRTAAAFCRWLYVEGLVERDPTVGAVRPKRPQPPRKYLRPDQLTQLIASLPDARARAVIWPMILMGLRCCEVAWARVEDWDPVDQSLVVRGKGGKTRVLPVPDAVAAAWTDYLNDHPASSGPLIRSYHDHLSPVLPTTVSTWVSRWMTSAGLRHGRWSGVSAHALRHTFGTDLYAKTHDIRLVAGALGHSSIETTQVYVGATPPTELRQAMCA